MKLANPCGGEPRKTLLLSLPFGWLSMNPQDPSSEDKAPLWMEIFNGQVVFKNGDEKEIQPNVRMPVAFPKSQIPAGPTTVLTIEVTYSIICMFLNLHTSRAMALSMQ